MQKCAMYSRDAAHDEHRDDDERRPRHDALVLVDERAVEQRLQHRRQRGLGRATITMPRSASAKTPRYGFT